MNILEEIVSVKKAEVKLLHKDKSLSRYSDSKFFEHPKRSLFKALTSENFPALIAEIKKASPSKGIIRNEFHPLLIAEDYRRAGVSAISILTDSTYFHGSLYYLKLIAEFDATPLLRKDFIIDEFQIYEAKANGADAVLLICECLSKLQIQELTHCAEEVGLEVLLELHDSDQISKIDFTANRIIGVNNRDLTTFETNLQTTAEVKELLPEGIALISESGINCVEDVKFVRETGADAVLVGEFFMRRKNIYEAVVEFLKWCENAD